MQSPGYKIAQGLRRTIVITMHFYTNFIGVMVLRKVGTVLAGDAGDESGLAHGGNVLIGEWTVKF